MKLLGALKMFLPKETSEAIKLVQNSKVFNSMLMAWALKKLCVMSLGFCVPELPMFLSELLLANFGLIGGVSGSFLRAVRGTGEQWTLAGDMEQGSGLLGGLSELSVDWRELDAAMAPRDLWSWGEDLDDREGDGDWCWQGDNVLWDRLLPLSQLLLCSENRRHEKKLGLEFLNDGELGGLGNFAGL